MSTLMLEEALSASHCVERQLANDERQYVALGAELHKRPPQGTVTIARGSSDHAAAYFAYLVMSRTGQLVTSLPMSLLTLYNAPMANQNVLAVSISQSGRSPDLIESMQTFRQAGATTVALVNDVTSPLADAVDWSLPLHAASERSVAATKSFICGLVAGARLAAQLGIRFCFAHFINADYGAQVSRMYRQQFQAGYEAAPYNAVALFVICADSEAEAADLAAAVDLRRLHQAYGINAPVPGIATARAMHYGARDQAIIDGERPRSIIGTPQQVAERMHRLREDFAADEIVVLTVAASYQARARSTELLAGIFNA